MPLKDIPHIRFEVEVDGQEYTLTPADDARVDREDLDEEFAVLPKTLAQWLMLQASIHDKIRRIKYERDKLYARLDFLVREEHKNSEIRSTEKMVENTVKTDAAYQDMLDKLFYYENALDMIGAGVESQRVKKDILISLGANDRTLARSNIRANADQQDGSSESTKEAVRKKYFKKVKKGSV